MSLKLVSSNDHLVVAIRDRVLPIVRGSGILQIQRDGLRRISLMMGPWSFSHWTPFRDLSPEEAASPGYRHAVEGQRPRPTMSYGLDVLHLGKQVLGLLWADDGTIKVTAFVRGDWEEEALALNVRAAPAAEGAATEGTE